MKSKFTVIIVFFSLTLNSCYYNAAIRNKISFNDDFKKVQNALFQMEKLMLKLPGSEFNTNYQIKNDTIIINDGPGRDNSIKYFTEQGLSVFSPPERKQFIFLARYLEKNGIASAYFQYNSKTCLFTYRQNPEDTFDDSRDISFSKNINDSTIKLECKILDRKDKLVLFAPKEAKIFDNFSLRKD